MPDTYVRVSSAPDIYVLPEPCIRHAGRGFVRCPCKAGLAAVRLVGLT